MSTKTLEERNKLIEDHTYLADRLAIKLRGKCIASITINDLKSEAYYGLLDAADKYNSDQGEFAPYAYFRICGAINDYLRQCSGKRSKKSKMIGWSLEVPILSEKVDAAYPLMHGLISNRNDNLEIDFDDLFDTVAGFLPRFYRNILYKNIVEEMTVIDIANHYKCSPHKISLAINQAKSTIRHVHDRTSLFKQIRPTRVINSFRGIA